MPKLPCVDCLVLAACKNKTKIICDLLYHYLANQKRRALMFKTFPKCDVVSQHPRPHTMRYSRHRSRTFN